MRKSIRIAKSGEKLEHNYYKLCWQFAMTIEEWYSNRDRVVVNGKEISSYSTNTIETQMRCVSD